MVCNTEDGEESAKIAFETDAETAQKFMRALDLVGISLDSVETRVDATIEGGRTVEV